MDPSLLAQPQSGLLDWVAQYGNVVYFFAQIAYWLLIVVLLGYAVAQFKRWVNYQLGVGRSGQLRHDLHPTDEPAKDAVSVEQFVD